MNMIYEIIGISCFAVLFAEVSGIMQWMKVKLMEIGWLGRNKAPIFTQVSDGHGRMMDHTSYVDQPRRLKPFDCPLCLAWWIGIIYFPFHVGVVEAVFYAAICSILSVIILGVIKKLPVI